ncbi:MAG: AI-2E family transporter, partial [Gemmatimonadota bacterium]|nr:AI-2E family transporter [Gemmatimonadota bacterium]
QTDMDKKTQKVEIKGPSLIQQVFGGTTALLSFAMVVIFLTYFLLASGELFLQKLVGVLPQLKDKKTAVRIVRETEAQVSLYLVVTTLINLGVGVATGVALALLGMPNPVLWGVIAMVLNFVPYIGGLVNTVVLALAAFLAFEDTTQALMVPLVFTVINILEGNLITPWVLGRRMRLNTVAVFVGLTFWWYLWGITGAILAVPIMASIKIACDHIAPLASVGEFLAE